MSSHGHISKFTKLSGADESVFLTYAWNKKYMHIARFILLRSTFTSVLKNAFWYECREGKTPDKGHYAKPWISIFSL